MIDLAYAERMGFDPCSVAPEVLDARDDARDRAAKVVADATWSMLTVQPFGEWVDRWNISEEQFATLIRSVALARANADGLRAWHLTNIANTVTACVTAMVEEHAFAKALEQTA